MTSPSRYAQMYAPLRLPNYRMFIAGQTISTIGTLIQMTAQSWVVFEITRSSAALGWVGLLGSLPILVFGPFAGALADRVNRRLLLIGTRTALALLAAAFAILIQTGAIEVWHIYLISFASGVVVALDMPALQAFAADLTGPALIRQAVTLNAMAFQTARMVGPSLAGLLLGWFGNATAFWVNATSCLAVILALWRVRFEAGERSEGASAPATGQGRSEPGKGGPREAISHVLAHPAMLDLYLFSMLFTFLVFSTMTVYPAFVADTLKGDASVLGFLMGASGAGSLFSSLVVLPVAHGVRRSGLLTAGALAWFGFMLTAMTFVSTSFAGFIEALGQAVGVQHPLPLVVAAFGFVQGLAGPIVMTTSMGLLQQMSPPHMRARMIGLATSMSFGMQPVAGLMVGYAGELLGPAEALRINGVLLVVGAAAMVAFRASVRAPSPAFAPAPGGATRPVPPEASASREANATGRGAEGDAPPGSSAAPPARDGTVPAQAPA